MRCSLLRPATLAAALAIGAACAAPGPSVPVIRLDTSDARGAAVIVDGLSSTDLATLSGLRLTDDQWSSLLRVTVRGPETSRGDLPAVLGRYSVGKDLRFTPAYPLDRGREYAVSFDPARLKRSELATVPAVQSVVSLPAAAHTPSTAVAAIYPSGDVIPANQLRMYLHFSGPMGQQGGMGHIAVLDAAGAEIADALLPLDTELWNTERTRYTLLFDPGRVKREILPNRQMGRPLRPGETITLVVKPDWLDAQGSPLKEAFSHRYRVGPPDEAPLATATWELTAPAAGSNEPLMVGFPEPLDRALLERSMSVSDASGPVTGEVKVDTGERRWTFAPRDPWKAGRYELAVLPILEDLAGNRIGRAFEVRSPGEVVAPEDARPTVLRFEIRPAEARR